MFSLNKQVYFYSSFQHAEEFEIKIPTMNTSIFYSFKFINFKDKVLYEFETIPLYMSKYSQIYNEF